MKPGAYGREIAGRWLLLLICLVLCAGAAAIYTSQTPREYSSSARLFVGLEPAKPTTGALYVAVVSTSLDDYVESNALANRVSRRLGGDVGPDALREAVVAAVVPDTTIIRITASDPDPLRARDIAGAYAEALTAEERSGQDDTERVWRVLDAPQIDDSPASRPWWRNLGVGAGVGLLVGLVLAVAKAARAAKS